MFKNWSLFDDFFIVLVVFLSYYHVAHTQAIPGKPAPAPAQRPIGNGPPKPGPGNTVGEIVVEIQTPPTTPSNINSVVNVKPADNSRPISPTPKPSVRPKPPVQPTKPPGPVKPTPVINVMSIKTGFLTAANDPCSYVSCIRADSYLHCALVRCDPGQSFSQASLRCLPSNQCPQKLPGKIQQKPSPQKLPQMLPKPQATPSHKPW